MSQNKNKTKMRKQLFLFVLRWHPLPIKFQEGTLLDYESCTWYTLCCKGNLSALKCLHERLPPNGDDRDNIAAIAPYFRRDMTDGLNRAAVNGHFDVVKFLYENYPRRCSDWAILQAEDKGHLDIVRYVCQKMPWDRYVSSVFYRMTCRIIN